MGQNILISIFLSVSIYLLSLIRMISLVHLNFIEFVTSV